MLFRSRDTTYSRSNAKGFQACFVLGGGGSRNYRAICCRMGYSADMRLSMKVPRGFGIATFWGSATPAEKVSCDVGCRSDSIAMSRDKWPLRRDRGKESERERERTKKTKKRLSEGPLPASPRNQPSQRSHSSTFWPHASMYGNPYPGICPTVC